MEFRLVVKSSTFPSRSIVTVAGQEWTVARVSDIESTDIPEYVAISYVWGHGREPNPMFPDVQMSDHTIPSLSAAIRHSKYSAFWIDALSVPTDPIAKSATLESMGYIYGRASQVIVVLLPSSFLAIQRMSRLGRSDATLDDVLEELERDMWVRSVWTYQELTNAREIVFVSEDPDDQRSIAAVDFLNALGYYLSRYRKQHDISSFIFRRKYPNVDAFEDLIADFMMHSFLDNSVLAIMSNMHRRDYQDPKNYYYSMIGAITKAPSKRSKNPSIQNLAESLMQICEEKGDYSFMFSANPRDERPGLTWRPRPEMLRSILPWHCFGEGFMGIKETGGIRLKNVIVERRAAHVRPLAREMLSKWASTGSDLTPETDEEMVRLCFDILKDIGFTGSQNHVLVGTGIFFPQVDIPKDGDFELWIAASLRYTFGAPALAVIKDDTRLRYIPGVYMGLIEDIPRSEVIIPSQPDSSLRPRPHLLSVAHLVLAVSFVAYVVYRMRR